MGNQGYIDLNREQCGQQASSVATMGMRISRPQPSVSGGRSCFSLNEGPLQRGVTQRVQVPNNEVLWFWVIVIIVQVLGKYMIIGYLYP